MSCVGMKRFLGVDKMKNDKLTIYLAGRMGGLTKTEYNTWREVLRKKLEIAAECCNSMIQVINPADYFDFDKIVTAHS